jgi:hypothetical protein
MIWNYPDTNPATSVAFRSFTTSISISSLQFVPSDQVGNVVQVVILLMARAKSPISRCVEMSP